MHEIDEDESEAQRQRLLKVISIAEDSCELIGGADLARVERGLRDKLREAIARGSAEAAAAAHFRGSVLWTDDGLLQFLAGRDLSAPRVWTQAVFYWAYHRGKIPGQHRSRVTARLLQFRYAFTVSSADVVLDTCEEALWLTEKPELTAVLSDFSNPQWDAESAFKVTAATVARVWREAPTESHARAVTNHLLVNLADRPDGHSIVQRLSANVESLLGMAITREESLREVLENFVRGRGPLV